MPAPWTATGDELHASLISRRRFLAGASAGMLALAAPRPARAFAGAPAAIGPAPKARNLIFFVVDGMGAGTPALAEYYQRYTAGTGTNWSKLSAEPDIRRSLQSTHSADGPVTDSAAASSAWSTGIKHANGSLCITPEGHHAEPFLLRAKRGGKAVGVVTTTTVTHATPGGFYANCLARDDEADIAGQLLERPVDLALGGAAKQFSDAQLAGVNGLRVLRGRADITATNTRGADRPSRVLGLLAPGHCPFALEARPEHPTLADCARFGLEYLAGATSGDGFVLQIEAGRVDHAAHNNDAGALLHEQLAADRALAVAVEFARATPGTLLIVTTDHATANPSSTFYGREGLRAMKRLAGVRGSLDGVFQRFDPRAHEGRPEPLAADLAGLLKDATGRTLADSELALLKRFLAGERVHPTMACNTPVGVVGGLLANHFGVAFLSPNHTADHVELFALGPGAEDLPPFIDNAQLHHWCVRQLGLPTT
jgi:alkaline phosphatase